MRLFGESPSSAATFWMSPVSPTASTVSPYCSSKSGVADISTSARLTRVICAPKRRAKSRAATVFPVAAVRVTMRRFDVMALGIRRRSRLLSFPTTTRSASSSSRVPTARSTSPSRSRVSGRGTWSVPSCQTRETTIPLPASDGTLSSAMPSRLGFATSRFARARGGASAARLRSRSSASLLIETRNAARTPTITRMMPSTPKG